MANSTNSLSNLDPSLFSTPSRTPAKKNDEIGKNEFLQLLVTQLKNQDPMNPMESEQFAVNLAQFSQVEQLVQINDKLGKQDDTGSLSSLASYLGNQVTLSTDKISVEGGDGGLMKLDLKQDASAVNLDILGSDGSVKKTVNLGALGKGKHTLDLNELGLPDGRYGFKVSAVSPAGGTFTPDVKVAGIVSGFVPGPDPMLLIGNQQVSPADIVEVSLAQ